MVYWKTHFSLANIFVLRLVKMSDIKQIAQAWTVVSHEFLVAEVYKSFKIYGILCDWYGEVCLIKKGLVKKTVHEIEIHLLSGQVNVPGAVICKGSSRTLKYSSLLIYWKSVATWNIAKFLEEVVLRLIVRVATGRTYVWQYDTWTCHTSRITQFWLWETICAHIP